MTNAEAENQSVGLLAKTIDQARTLVAAAIFFFGSWSVLTFPFDDAVVRAIFFGFTLGYTFFFYGWRKGTRGRVELTGDIAAGLLGMAIALYIAFGFEDVFARAGEVTTLDMTVAGLAIVLVLEATRRTAGLALPILSIVFFSTPGYTGSTCLACCARRVTGWSAYSRSNIFRWTEFWGQRSR